MRLYPGAISSRPSDRPAQDTAGIDAFMLLIRSMLSRGFEIKDPNPKEETLIALAWLDAGWVPEEDEAWKQKVIDIFDPNGEFSHNWKVLSLDAALGPKSGRHRCAPNVRKALKEKLAPLASRVSYLGTIYAKCVTLQQRDIHFIPSIRLCILGYYIPGEQTRTRTEASRGLSASKSGKEGPTIAALRNEAAARAMAAAVATAADGDEDEVMNEEVAAADGAVTDAAPLMLIPLPLMMLPLPLPLMILQ